MSVSAIISWISGLVSPALSLLSYKDSHKIELVAARLDLTACNWKPDDTIPNVYWINREQNTSPIFDFTFFNHYKKPVVLTAVRLHMKFLPVGLSGAPEPALVVKPFARYAFAVKYGKEDYTFMLPDPVEIAPERSFRFQLELLLDGVEPLKARYGLHFTFGFNNKEALKAPVLLLNSDNEQGLFKIKVLN